MSHPQVIESMVLGLGALQKYGQSRCSLASFRLIGRSDCARYWFVALGLWVQWTAVLFIDNDDGVMSSRSDERSPILAGKVEWQSSADAMTLRAAVELRNFDMGKIPNNFVVQVRLGIQFFFLKNLIFQGLSASTLR